MGIGQSTRRPGEIIDEVDLRSRVLPPGAKPRPKQQQTAVSAPPTYKKHHRPLVQKTAPTPVEPVACLKQKQRQQKEGKGNEKMAGPGADPKNNKAWMGNEVPVMGPGMLPALGPPASPREIAARNKAAAKRGAGSK